MRVRIYLFIFNFGCLANGLSGQYGFQIYSGFNQFSNNNNTQVYTPKNAVHLSLGPSFWFRLKYRRIEFNPSLLLDYGKYQLNSLSEPKIDLNEWNGILNFPILIYPFDFGNDCNCPTFNKQGQFIKKGFHFLVNPSLIYLNQRINPQLKTVMSGNLSYQMGLGVGIDIGINRKWTFSPGVVFSKFFSDHYHFSTSLEPISSQDVSRNRLDILMRFMWYAKKKRY